MSVRIGTRLGSYEIVAPLGAGGMGEVYRARDTRLGRDVAIKVLPDAFNTDTERTARFEREAKLLAALNHPNIASIYGFEAGALIMELVEGDSPKGPMPLAEAWPVASQIISALEYAHEHGIVHRDLKPANIKITADGHVKLLDFGLAKAFTEPAAAAATNASNSPTLTMATDVGVILGTAAYMAPEQAKGRSVDKRADIWAFGVVLYEMLTGRQLFEAEDVSETLAQVLTKQPDLQRIPAKARMLLQSCLEKDPKRRLRDIGDAQRLLPLDSNGSAAAPMPKKLTAKIAAAAVVLLFVPAAILSWIHLRETSSNPPIVRSFILPPENTMFDFAYNNGVGLFALSPDGRKLVFTARTAGGNAHLWLRPLDAMDALPLPGTEGAAFPFWSPDNRFVGFFADGALKKLDTTGGPPVTLAEARAGRGGTWSKDNVIVFAPSNNDPLYKVSTGGGAATPVTKFVSDDGPQRYPWFLPDGRHFIYRVQGAAPNMAVRIGSLDSMEPKILGAASSHVIYASGYLFFRRETTLMAEPFDVKTLSVTGEAVALAKNVNVGLSAGFFSVSDAGVLVYQTSKTALADSSGQNRTLTWIDRAGKELEKLRNPGDIGDIELSPDRTKLAYTLWGSESTNRDVWIYDVARQVPSRFTFDPAIERYPIWSSDGKSIAFTANRGGHGAIYRKATDLTGVEEKLWESVQTGTAAAAAVTSSSPDGQFLLVNGYSASGKAGMHIWKLQLMDKAAQSPTASPFLDSGEFTERDGRFSPDGRWVVYGSDESGRGEIYVTAFPEARGKRQVSNDGGITPRWSADGKEIFYVDLNSTLLAVEVINRGGSIEVGQVHPIVRGIINQHGYLYDVSKDGKRFLVDILTGAVERTLAQDSAEPLTLIFNWPALLKKGMP